MHWRIKLEYDNGTTVRLFPFVNRILLYLQLPCIVIDCMFLNNTFSFILNPKPYRYSTVPLNKFYPTVC